MSYQVLARKWRPRTFEQLVGQEHVSQALINGLDQDRLHHAFLLTGTRGIGKTTIARILAKCLNCEKGMSSQPCGECGSCVDVDEGRFVDMIEIDAASRTGVEDMRDLLESVQYTPTRGRYKIYIIDEVHMLSTSSFNALLKTLEEPPPHVKFVMATTDPHKIPVTILSRCLRFNLRRLLPGQIQAQLEAIVNAENIASEEEALTVLARAADGSMRDGLSLLDQAVAYGGGRLVLDDLKQMLGLIDHENIASIVRALAEGDATALLEIVAELAAQSRDLESVLVDLAELLHRVTLVQCAPGYRDADRSDWPSIEELAGSLGIEDAQLFYQVALKGRSEIGLAPDPRTGLEMTLLRMLAFRPANAAAPGSVAPTEVRPSSSRGAQTATGGSPQTPAGTRTAKAEPGSAPAPAPASASAPAAETSAQRTPVRRPNSNAEWLAMLDSLDITGQVRELARNIEFASSEGSKWSFRISPALRNLAAGNCLARLEQSVSSALGETVRIQLVDARSKSLHTAAKAEQQRAHQTMSEAEKAIQDDPTVRALKDTMDARVIDDSVQPIQ
ncbi:MAG: DNA polymerase III subunit gamma/tau [Lysobacterales bacterium]|jgi:DNA polymerase-3 subunit gamma/tau